MFGSITSRSGAERRGAMQGEGGRGFSVHSFFFLVLDIDSGRSTRHVNVTQALAGKEKETERGKRLLTRRFIRRLLPPFCLHDKRNNEQISPLCNETFVPRLSLIFPRLLSVYIPSPTLTNDHGRYTSQSRYIAPLSIPFITMPFIAHGVNNISISIKPLPIHVIRP